MSFLKVRMTIGNYTVIKRLDDGRYAFREVYQVRDALSDDVQTYVFVVYDVEAWKKEVGNRLESVPELEIYAQLHGKAFPMKRGEGVYKLNDGRHLNWTCLHPIAGISLASLIHQKKAFGGPTIAKIGLQLTKAAREISVIMSGGGHYNLQPENIFLTDETHVTPKVQVCGFTHTGKPFHGRPNLCGQPPTKEFCAPEAMIGVYSELSDVFTIGKVMKTLAEITKSHENMDLDAGLWKMIEKASNKKRSQRYRSLTALEKDMTNWIMKSGADDAAADEKKDNDRSPSAKQDQLLQYDGVIERRKGKGFAAVAGCEELKDNFMCNFVSILKNQELARQMGIKPPNSILLFGPPGNGKTFFAERLAEECDINFTMITPSSLASSFLHGTQQIMADLFRKLEKKAPVLLAFDEFDAIAPDRAMEESHHQGGEVNELLSQLNNAADRGIYVLMMTNYPERVDPAILRKGRVDNIIYVGLPDEKTRKQIFELELSERAHEKVMDFEELSLLTKNFSSSDISYVVKEAARRNFSYCVREKVTRPIPFTLIKEVISQTVPSVTPEQLRHYENMRRKMLQQTPERPRIGF